MSGTERILVTAVFAVIATVVVEGLLAYRIGYRAGVCEASGGKIVEDACQYAGPRFYLERPCTMPTDGGAYMVCGSGPNDGGSGR